LDYYYEDEELSIELPKDYEVIVLGAAHMTKRITNVLAEKIINKSKYPIILLGGKDVAGQAKNLVKSKVTDLTSRTTLNQAAKIIQGAVLVHTGDTGLMHMAAALKKPTHVYWANTHPKMGMYPYYGDYAIYTKWFEVEGLSCRPCSKLGHPVCPEGHHKCMDHNIDLV
jgi:ADP-heptose:LPS heptosyltransferase